MPMALGKAFIEVHADTKPFAKELGRELGRILAVAERTPARRIGERVGREVSEGIGDGVRSGRGRIRRGLDDALPGDAAAGLGARLATGIIDTIDDGLSGLPGEVKAALVGVVIAISPLIGAALAGAIAAGLIIAFSGIGVLLAAQFEIVRDEWATFTSDVRRTFTDLGSVFVYPLLRSLGMIRDRIDDMSPAFQRIFAVASTFLEPLTEAILDAVEVLLPYLERSLRNVADQLPEIGDSFVILAEGVGYFLEIVTQSQYAGKGLKALAILVAVLVGAFGRLIQVLTEAFGWLYKIFLLINDKDAFVAEWLGINTDKTEEYARQNLSLAESTGLVIAATTEEEKALQAQQKAMEESNEVLKQYVDDMLGAWDANIDFEQSLDDMAESLKKNKGNLDLNSQAGRDHQRAILNGVTALRAQRDATIASTGKTEEANRVFETNRKRLEDAAVAAGISRTKFQELTAAVTNVPYLPSAIVPQTILDRLATAIRLATTFGGILSVIRGAYNFGKGQGLPAFADGAVVSQPTVGLIGEAGPEAVIPLNNPARAAQLMNQSGLSSMMSPTVNVYIGTQQIDAYIDNRVDRRMGSTARGLAYGSRSV